MPDQAEMLVAAKKLVDQAHALLRFLTPEQRIILRGRLFGGDYCCECGKEEPCYCSPVYDE